MQNDFLSLQPLNYYTLRHELCFFIGDGVANKYTNEAEDLTDELLDAESITVCTHKVNENYDFYILMTPNHYIYATRSSNNNFQVSRIDSGREFQQRKKYIYNQGVFLISLYAGASVVLRKEKYTSCSIYTNDWGMDPYVLNDLCYAIDEYFDSDNKRITNKVDLKFDKQVLQHIKNYTKYEDIAEQIAFYGNNYIDYDRYEFVSGNSRRKVYDFFSSSFDPDSELYQIGDRVALETSESINDELRRKINGTIIDRVIEDDCIRMQVEFMDQFDNNILVVNHGHIFPQANEIQKKVREDVIRSIVNGTVESEYMYQLFSRFRTAGYEEQEDWGEFYDELMSKKYPPNKSQMEAIKRGIETKDIQLVLGPPGTGKTTVIVSWIEYFISHDMRVLVSSQNNSAVDNVLERVSKNPAARIIRLGNIEKVQENCKQYTTERQIDKTAERYIERLNKSREIVTSDISVVSEQIAFIESISSDFERLDNYYSILNGYKSQFSGIIDDLQQSWGEYGELYKKYKENNEKRLHKEIYIFAMKRKNPLYRFFHLPVTLKVKRELSVLQKIVHEGSDLCIKKLIEYNGFAKALRQELNNKQYVELKTSIETLVQKCTSYELGINLQGVLSAPKMVEDDTFCQTGGSYVALMEYKEKLKDIEQRLVKINSTLDDWEISVRNKRNEIVTNLIIQNSNVVGATCIGINTQKKFKNIYFDVSIIDESGQIQIHNAIVPMSRAPKTLMLGDHLQIPPMANETVISLCKQEGIKTDLLEMSFFEFLFTKLEKKDKDIPNITRLDEQFRMPGNISDVISDWFYEGNYHAHYDMSKWEPLIKGTNSPLIMISTSNSNERFEQNAEESIDNSPGYCNPLEAEIIANIIVKVFEGKETLNSEQIGVISAYGKQVRMIRQKIKEKKIGFTNEQVQSMAASLDSFQGQERPLIIYSSTRSTAYKSPKQARVGFMKELRRLNVAFTRCQKQLVIIGDFDYLTSCEYEEFDSETEKPIPNKSEKKYAEFMQKMVNQAKSEQGEFYDLKDFYKKVGIDETN